MAENKDGQEKTEQASAKRLHEARMRGQVSKSMDVTTAAVMLIGGVMVFVLGAPLINNYKQFMSGILHNCASIELTTKNVGTYYFELMSFLAKILLPILVVMFFIVLTTEISQVGFKFATKKFSEGLNLKQIFNPFSGLKKIFFSGRSMFELLKSVIKLLIIGVIVYQILDSKSEQTIGLLQMPFIEIGNFLVEVSFELVVKVGAVYIIIAAGDFFYQRYRFKEDMKMTKQEVKEENKQSEGDPKVKARLRSILRQRIRKLMLKNVAKSDVVITNPTHYAIAISYKPEKMNAPVVMAKGADYIALQIRQKADEAGVPIVQDPPLARALFFSVEIDQAIPENLFKAVAQVLAYVYNLRGSA